MDIDGFRVYRQDSPFLQQEEVKAVARKKYFSRKYLLPISLAMVTTIIVAWAFLYQSDQQVAKEKQEIIVVKNQEEAVKIEPDDPGGMKIDHLEMKIFDSLTTTPNKVQEEVKLLPQPEEPLDPVQLFEKSAAIESSKVQVEETKLGQLTKPEEQQNAVVLPQVVAKQEGNHKTTTAPNNNGKKLVLSDTKNKKFVEKSGVKQKNSVKLKVKDNKLASGKGFANKQPIFAAKEITKESEALRFKTPGFYVQLATYKSEQAAQQSWHRLKTSQPIVKHNNYYIERRKVGRDAATYKLQLGPFRKASDALAMCDRLKVSSQACTVVK